MDRNHLASTKPLIAYSIFCGVLEYSDSILEKIKSGSKFGFETWKIHVNPDNKSSAEIIKDFNDYYYENFVNTIFLDIDNTDSKRFNSDFAKKTARLSLAFNKEYEIKIGKRESSPVLNIKFEYLDLFFFPDGLVFYCFKCDLSTFSLDEITLINSYLRNSGITNDMKFLYDKLSFINPSTNLNTDHDSLSIGNKMKVFSIIELKDTISEEEENMLLFDLGTCSPIGSASGHNSYFQPSTKYFEELIEKNKISVFNNWSALALFDTFTGLFQRGARNNFIWENGYFNLLYLQSLYVKNHLFKVNKLFYAKGANHQKLEDELFEFNKYYNPSIISYNFLPTIIYEKIRYSLGINGELEKLKEGVERTNLKNKEKRDKAINNVLTIIALLTVFTVVWDLSDWIKSVFMISDTFYNILSVALTAIFLLLIFIFFYRNYRKRSKR